ncbi:MAG: outer membrane protein assembly factor BamD [Bacteroidetes bacterium]|nr:outer membrane protein assembly factor BamD [Bacteroidota bacterium]
MFRDRYIFLVLIVILIFTSCSKHQKIMKSSDNELKYEAAIDYYERGDYYRALQLFESLMGIYRGTAKAEQMYYYYAYCYYNQDEYLLASYYFKRYAQSYPNAERAEECMFMSAYCQYLLSPKFSLDQTATYEAIKELQLFIDLFPASSRKETSNQLIDELRAKLEKKDFEIAKQYLKTEHYQAAITAFLNLTKDYPDTENREDILYYILKSYYYYAEKSIEDKQLERYQAAIEAYNDLIYLYPETRYGKDADGMHQDARKKINN